MKKFSLFFAMLIMACMIAFTSCSKCTNQAVEPEVLQDDTAEVVVGWNVENVTNADKQYMFINYGNDYRWFEECILLKDYLDSDDCDGTVVNISNVFQKVDECEGGADVHVIFAVHTPDTVIYDVKEGFWVGDEVLNDDVIALTFEDAFARAIEANYPKPHSRHCVLRKEIGVLDINPQYIFGNTQAQLYVDAVTGEVTDQNPAFPHEKGYTMPLGEWP